MRTIFVVDGSWKAWETWSECSTTCGGGQRNRTRECNDALHGGTDCIGESMQNESCNTQNCPGIYLSYPFPEGEIKFFFVLFDYAPAYYSYPFFRNNSHT